LIAVSLPNVSGNSTGLHINSTSILAAIPPPKSDTATEISMSEPSKQDQQKRKAAEKAIELIPRDCVIGVGTGSTTNIFIAPATCRSMSMAQMNQTSGWN